jgi:hypothetical protein
MQFSIKVFFSSSGFQSKLFYLGVYMNPETIQTLTTWLGLIINFLSIVAGIGLFAVAIYQSLKSRAVRWDALLFAGFLLWIFPYGIRNYAPALTDATIDLFNSMAGKREPMEEAIKAFIGETNEQLPIVPDVSTSPVVIDTSQPAVIITSTPFPNYAATATALAPTPTPFVMIEPTWTVEPTRYICRTIEDIQAGCTPPTPQPGN